MYTIALGALRSMHMTSQPMYIASASNWLIGLLLGYFLTFRLEWDIAGYVVCKNCCPKEESRALMIAGINALCKGLFGYSSRARLLRKRLYVFYCSCWGGLVGMQFSDFPHVVGARCPLEHHFSVFAMPWT